MVYIKFSLSFILAHIVAYIIAGSISLKISKDIYESKMRHCDFLRDMSDEKESLHVSRYFLLGQLLRGLLMSMVLFPLIDALAGFSFLLKFIFFVSLMFVYTHLAAVSPFIDNIEGLIYFKKDYIKKRFIFKFQLEMVIYSLLFGILMVVFFGLI